MSSAESSFSSDNSSASSTLTMFFGRGAGSPNSSGSACASMSHGSSVRALDPGPPEPDRLRPWQPAELRRVSRAVDQHLEPVGPAPERVLLVVGQMDDAVAGPELVDLLVLPRETGSAEDVDDLLGGAVGVGRGRQPPRIDLHAVDADSRCSRRRRRGAASSRPSRPSRGDEPRRRPSARRARTLLLDLLLAGAGADLSLHLLQLVVDLRLRGQRGRARGRAASGRRT